MNPFYCSSLANPAASYGSALAGAFSLRITSLLKGNSSNYAVFGNLKGRRELQHRSFLFIVNSCLPLQYSSFLFNDLCPGGNYPLLDRVEKFRLQRNRGKVSLNRSQTLDGHDNRGVGQTNQSTTMHEPSALSVVDKKRHGQGGSTVGGFDYLHVQQPLKGCTTNPTFHVKLMRASVSIHGCNPIHRHASAAVFTLPLL